MRYLIVPKTSSRSRRDICIRSRIENVSIKTFRLLPGRRRIKVIHPAPSNKALYRLSTSADAWADVSSDLRTHVRPIKRSYSGRRHADGPSSSSSLLSYISNLSCRWNRVMRNPYMQPPTVGRPTTGALSLRVVIATRRLGRLHRRICQYRINEQAMRFFLERCPRDGSNKTRETFPAEDGSWRARSLVSALRFDK